MTSLVSLEPSRDQFAMFVAEHISDHVLHVAPIVRRAENIHTVVSLTDGMRVFVKAFEEQRASAADREERSLLWLSERNVPVPRLRGRLKTAGWRFVATEYVEGKSPLRSNATLYRLGVLAARLHGLSPALELPPYEYTSQRLSADIAELDECDPVVRRLVEDGLEHRRVAQLLSLPSGFAHCDLRLSNAIEDASGMLWLVDFEHASYEPHVLDLAWCVVFSCRSESDIDIALCRALIAGYETARLLTRSEKLGAAAALRFAAAIAVFWRYRQHVRGSATAEFYKAMLDPCSNLLRRADDELVKVLFC
jgi:Ser/Thr protein kinase RdoA (MazF antagonist)